MNDGISQAAPEWRLGPYGILRELGRGGMGRVFLAARADDQYQKLVAIKIADPAILGGLEADLREAAIQRFRFERQMLAVLDHPNCVRLIDGGTTPDGLPYLVMDYVEGQPLLEFCGVHRLRVRQRLELFRQICAGVQYAHQRMIVHGDIKPANLMVTGEGIPKLLDFGISRLLSQTLHTGMTGMFRSSAMSLAYASPEQVGGEPPTVATDIYALGILLCELVTERYPYAMAEPTPMALTYAIANTVPLAPSRAAPGAGLDADFDAIAAKAMHKNAADRYASVAHLAEDVRRWLEKYPVSARHASPAHRLRRFVERHPLASMAASAAAAVLVLAVAGIVWQGWVAHQERLRAEARFQQVRELAHSFLFDFSDAVQDIPGTTSVRLLVARKASEYLDGLSKDASGDTSLEIELADSYIRLGNLEGDPYSANVGEPEAARRSYEQSIRIASDVLRRESGNRSAGRGLALARERLGGLLASQGKLREALEHLRGAARDFEALARDAPRDAGAEIECSEALEILADTLGHPGLASQMDAQAARDLYEKCLAVWARVLAIEPAHPRAPRARAVLTMKIADIAAYGGDVDGSLALYRKAVGYLDQSAGSEVKTEAQRLRSMLYHKIAYELSYNSDPKPALEEYARAVAIIEQLVARDPKDARLAGDLGVILRDRGELREGNGDTGGALEDYGRVVESVERAAAADPTSLRLRERMSEMLLRIGRLLVATGQTAEARRQSLRGLEMARQMATDPNATTRQFTFYAEALLRVAPEDLRRPAEARGYAERASSLLKDSSAQVLDLVAQAAFQSGDRPRAIAYGEKALALIPAGSPAREQFEQSLREYRGEKR